MWTQKGRGLRMLRNGAQNLIVPSLSLEIGNWKASSRKNADGRKRTTSQKNI
jgi:hypothetical protein